MSTLLLLLFLRRLNIKDLYLFNAFFQLLFTTRILLMRAARMSSYDCMKKWKISKLILSTNIIFLVWIFSAWSISFYGVRLTLCQCQMWCNTLALPWAGVGPDDLCCSMVLLLFKIISVTEEITHAYVKMLLWTKFYPLLWLCSAVKTVESH